MNKVKIPVKFYVSLIHFDKYANPGCDIIDWEIEVDEKDQYNQKLVTNLAIAKQNELIEKYASKGCGYAMVLSQKTYDRIMYFTQHMHELFPTSKKKLEDLAKNINWDIEMIKTDNDKIVKVYKGTYVAFQILKVLEK